MKQQTAVEWLLEKIQLDHSKLYENIQKAKQIEKQQIIDAVTYGKILEFYDGIEIEVAEQYYNETYGK